MSGSKFVVKCIPQELHRSVVLKNLKEVKYNTEHQIIVPITFFDVLYEENIFYRDENSLWVTAIVTKHEKKKFNTDISIVKNFIRKEFGCKKSIDKAEYGKSKDFVEVERVVQIIPFEKLNESEVCVTHVELFNLNTTVSDIQSRNENLYLRFLPIKHMMLAPSFAQRIVLEMVRIPMYIGTDLIDTMVGVYFETPKYLHTGDYFEIDLVEKFTRHLHFKYLNLVKYIKKLRFKCKMIGSDENSTKGYFVVRGETELLQDGNINSFIPRINSVCIKSHDSVLNSVDCIDELFYGNCPFGLDSYLNKLKIAVEPFLINKKVSPIHNELKCSLQAVFLLRGDSGSGCRLLVTLLAEQMGLHFISMSCYQIMSSTAKQTEAKLDALIQKAKDVAPVIIYIENFEIFGMTAEGEEDVRLTASLQTKLKNLFDNFVKYPVIFIINCPHDTELKQNLSRIFLEEFQIKKLTSQDKLKLFKWMIIDKDISLCDSKYELLKNISDCLHKESVVSLDKLKTESVQISEEDVVEMDSTVYLCELCRRKKYYDDILEKIISKTEGFQFGDINSLIHLVLQDGYINQMKFLAEQKSYEDNVVPNIKLIREVDFDVGIDTLRSLQNKKLAPLKIPKVQWDDIGGLENLKKEIIRTIELPLKFPHMFAKSGLKRSGILLWGPPGCGKTLVARAIASQLNANFLSIKGPELLDMYVGQSEKNMREVFATARSSAPCVIFFDEAEAAAGSRGAAGDSGGAADRLVSQLLAELDGVASAQIDSPNAAVVVVAATNRPDLVEPALMRPGRIDKLIYVGPYVGLTDKVRVLKASCRGHNLGKSVDLDAVASNLPEKCTGADLSSIVNHARHQALVKAVRNAESGSIDPAKLSENDIMIEQEDLLSALVDFVPSISKDEMNHYESLRTKLS
ncbi:peroxisomal biogenesis factor 6 [Arctopsyche grandis]|uniref:peroxisomal biogenesis factor 6 n=1 Tax=Arctopsyche grandis TaxID=121162 RepID=UPI00406D7004